jgi:homogentisate solanesyltransferase
MNFGVYHATSSALALPFSWTPPIVFLAAFMSLFACVIALAKDLPDIRGDRLGNVPTFATRLGPRKVLRAVAALLFANYAAAITFPLLAPSAVTAAFNLPVMVAGHVALAAALAFRIRRVDPDSQASIVNFYAFIWSLFYAEYCLFPFI